MSGSQTQAIRSFLVKLGFSINTQQQQQFTGAIRKATLEAHLLADTLEAAARKSLDFARSVANAMEDLYFASQRTGITAANLRALDYAMGQVGAGAGNFKQMADSLRDMINAAPGMQDWINQLVGPQGGLEEQMKRMFQRWRSMWGTEVGRMQAIAEAGSLHFDQRTITQIVNNLEEFNKQGERAARVWKSLGIDDATARRSHEFGNTIRETGMVLEGIFIKLGDMLGDKWRPLIERFNQYLIDHTSQIAAFIDKVATGIQKMVDYIIAHWNDITKFFDDLGTGLVKAWDTINSVVDALGGWKTATELLFGLWLGAKFAAFLANIRLAVGAFNPLLAGILTLLELKGDTAPLSPEDKGKLGERNRQETLEYLKTHPDYVPPGGWEKYGGDPRLQKQSQPSATPDATAPGATGSLKKILDISDQQYDVFRSRIAAIESGGRYDIMGGSSGRFAGKYQMGGAEIAESARSLGEPVPTREQFLHDPSMQERFMEAYTLAHHQWLMSHSPQYAALSPEEKLAVLGYAHNQGAAGASRWLRTGIAGSDAFGTSGRRYYDDVLKGLHSPSLAAPAPGSRGSMTTQTATVTNNNTFNIAATDPRLAGREVADRMDRQEQGSIRWLRGAFA